MSPNTLESTFSKDQDQWQWTLPRKEAGTVLQNFFYLLVTIIKYIKINS